MMSMGKPAAVGVGTLPKDGVGFAELCFEFGVGVEGFNFE
jgi:hypothetical protein